MEEKTIIVVLPHQMLGAGEVDGKKKPNQKVTSESTPSTTTPFEDEIDGLLKDITILESDMRQLHESHIVKTFLASYMICLFLMLCLYWIMTNGAQRWTLPAPSSLSFEGTPYDEFHHIDLLIIAYIGLSGILR
jgi:hypothetical protein